ncbi:MAG: 23S rRNA (guanosine(2251)-2'-O)-methyltransferase RlmB [bacterium]|nr:23S rRNA (guanosine(2251)-2'-O)-methyltransferase RlmB [bacterium]
MNDLLWIVGFHAVLDALEGSRNAEVVWLQGGRRDRRTRQIFDAARDRGLQVKYVERRRLDEVSEGVPHNGCAVRCAPIEFSSLDDLVSDVRSSGGILLMDGVQDPHNLGSVIRSAAAFGVRAVILAGHSLPPVGGAAAKAAAGQLSRVMMVRVNVAADALSMLQSEDYWIFGADMSGTPISKLKVPAKWVLCVGEEKRGLRAKTRSKIDELVAIPMREGVESLNLSVSAGILLYEFVGMDSD